MRFSALAILGASLGAVASLLAGCGEEEPLYKAARYEVENRPSCTKPVMLTAALAKDLAAMDVLACKTPNPADCQSKGIFTNVVRVEGRRDPLFNQESISGPRQIMICGKARIDKFTGKDITPQSTLSADKYQATVEYVVTPELSEEFKKQPQANDLLAKLGKPVTFSSLIVMVGDGNSWRRR